MDSEKKRKTISLNLLWKLKRTKNVPFLKPCRKSSDYFCEEMSLLSLLRRRRKEKRGNEREEKGDFRLSPSLL